MKDLGLQSVQSVASSASTSSNPLARLTDIVHNFPRHATSLSRVKVSETLREEVMRLVKGVLIMI